MSEFIVNTLKGHTANAKLTVDDTLEVTEIANLDAGVAVLGGATVSGGLTVNSGGIDITGAAVLNDGVDSGLTVNDGGADITGNSVVTGTLNVTSDLTVNTNKLTVDGATGDTDIAGDVTLADDKVLALSASGTGATSLLTATNPSGTIASLQTIGSTLGLQLGQSDGIFQILDSTGTVQVIRMTADGIITGPSSVPTDITTGATSGKVFDNTGNLLSSKSGAGTQTHHAFYDASGGQAGKIQTDGAGGTTYAVTSDPRTKVEIARSSDLDDNYINSEWSKVIPTVIRYNPKGDLSQTVLGFDAHDLIDASPECRGGTEGEGPRDAELNSVYDTTEETYTEIEVQEIDGEEVEVEVEKTRTIEHRVTPAGVDQAKLVPLLMLKIEQLEKRLSKLEV